jgi:type II secretory pathway pseudopilin PulG
MKKGGFTIIEILAVIFFLSVAMVGALIAIQQTMAWTETSFQRLTAIYLAQEGIEIVRNIRDTNWLKNNVWDQGLSEGDWETDYQSQTLDDNYDGAFLLIDGGFYNYTSGTSTPFKRKVTISDKTADQMKVTVTVSWEAKGEHQISAQEILYNWRQ